MMNLANSCLSDISPSQFFGISEQYPDLVKHLQQQLRSTGQFGLDGKVPCLSNTDGALCFICKSETKDFNHFIFLLTGLRIYTGEYKAQGLT